jgi:DNA polymerase I-like protein with 3'-5' exonuclease and polymerase domains
MSQEVHVLQLKASDFSTKESKTTCKRIKEHIHYDVCKLIALDTETMHKAARPLFDASGLFPGLNITKDAIWEAYKTNYPDKGLSIVTPLLTQYGETLPEKWTKVQFNTAFKALTNAIPTEVSDVVFVQFGTYVNDAYHVVLIQMDTVLYHKNLSALFEELFNSRTLLIQNAQFDICHIYKTFGVRITSPCIDTSVNHALLNTGYNPKCSLKDLCVSYNLPEEFRKKDEAVLEIYWTKTDNPDHLAYAINDIVAILAIFEKQKPLLSKANMMHVLSLEARLAPILARATIVGFQLNQETIVADIQERQEAIKAIEEKLLAVCDNLGLSQEALEAMPHYTENAKMLEWVNTYLPDKLPSLEKKEFFSLGLGAYHPSTIEFMAYLIEIKSHLTQISSLQSLVGKKSFHPQYVSVPTRTSDYGGNEGGAVTGRMSCRPTIQTTPKHRKKHFVPPPGYCIVGADYAAIEFRVMGELAEEQVIIDMIKDGVDPHCYFGERAFKKPVTKGMRERQIAKMGNFGFIFGLWHTTFAKRLLSETQGELVLSEAEAKNLRDTFFLTYPRIAKYNQECFEKGVIMGYISTAAGRRRYWNRDEFYEKRAAMTRKGFYVAPIKPFHLRGMYITDPHMMERYADLDWRNVCYNTPVQGTAADGMKQAVTLIPDWLIPIALVHDSIDCLCPIGREEEGYAALEKAMIDGMKTYIKTIPIEVEGGVSHVWQ